IVYTIFRVDVRPKEEVQQNRIVAQNTGEQKIGRNDPCPCGSGKKYKKCGLLNTQEHQKLMTQKNLY
ncbi:MAG: SEC-C metal-binding domain-containing protein, partial [bacterium]|nr:SEC-C metal-binding domain-containing protein [bacterium]